MKGYASTAADVNILRTPHVPSPRWSLLARLAASWWRNKNTRGIADPDPRTVAPGARPSRTPRAPAPHSRRRTKRELQLAAQLPQVPALDRRLMELANVWPDAERPRALARTLHATERGLVCLIPVPPRERESYPLATRLYLPRRGWADAARFVEAFRAARRFLNFAERTLQRSTRERLAGLLAGLRPSPRAEGQPITRRPYGVQVIDPHGQHRSGTEDWKAAAERIGRHIVGGGPPTTT